MFCSGLEERNSMRIGRNCLSYNKAIMGKGKGLGKVEYQWTPKLHIAAVRGRRTGQGDPSCMRRDARTTSLYDVV